LHLELSDKLCLPGNLTGEEAVSVFVRKLREIAQTSNKQGSPPAQAKQFLSESANISVAAALALQYHCPK
jgi:hypothetical protein